MPDVAKTKTDTKSVLYLSPKRTMFLGRLAPVLQQAGAASALIFSLDDTLAIVDNTNQQSFERKSFLIPAGARVTIHTHDSPIGLCFLDTLGTDLAILKVKMREAISLGDNTMLYSGMPGEARAIAKARECMHAKPSAEDALNALDQWIGSPTPACDIQTDERVTRAVDMIKNSVIENRSVEEIARELNLSVPRLSQLFKQITGVPIRRFRVWHRIFITAVKMGCGMTLTEAAVSSGFSDSAHFSRTFKQIGGVKPSVVLNARKTTVIRILGDLPTTQDNPLASIEALTIN